MAEITSSMVRELRERTGAGMMDCKKALGATQGDMEAAIDHLRKQGLKSAEKKAGRETSEGLVNSVVGPTGRVGSMVAVACETDFVTSTEDFQRFVAELTDHVAEHAPADAQQVLGQPWKGGGTVEDALKQLVGKVGENARIHAVCRLENPEGFVATYVHHNKRVGAMVSVTTAADRERAQEFLRDLCMHIAFAKPDALKREEIPAETIERERAIYAEEVKGKPADIQERILNGKLEKFFAGRLLPEQPWIRDDKLSVQRALEQALGGGSRIETFACFIIGA